MKAFSGLVVKGVQRGRVLGYPTINIACSDKDVSGIYAARVLIGTDAPYMAAVFADPKRDLLEAHILDFSNDLYGVEVRIELHEKIRESKHFDSEDELRAAIAADVEAVRQYFNI